MGTHQRSNSQLELLNSMRVSLRSYISVRFSSLTKTNECHPLVFRREVPLPGWVGPASRRVWRVGWRPGAECDWRPVHQPASGSVPRLPSQTWQSVL